MNTEYWQLRAAARNYYDAYRLVVKLGNRIGAMAREGHAEPLLNEQLEAAKAGQDGTAKILVKLYRQVAPAPIVAFQQDTPGLGETMTARLVGEVGDFRTFTEAWWTEDPDGDEKRVLAIGEVRTCGVRDIYSFCGHGDPSRRRRKGMTAEDAAATGNPNAKMITFLITDFALRLTGKPDKNGRERAMTPYYPHYLRWKEDARRAHPDWSAGHVDGHAKRKVGKAILKDIWRVQHGQEPAYGGPTPWTPRAAAA